MQNAQLEILKLWHRAEESLHERAHDDRGEVTGQTALIVLLVGAAILAGGAIAAAMASNTSNIPTP